MKKIVFIGLISILLSFTTFAQVFNLPKNFDQIAKEKYSRIKTNFDGDFNAYRDLLKYEYAESKFIEGQLTMKQYDSATALTSVCRDPGFEENNTLYWANWHGYFGNFTGSFDCSSGSTNNMHSYPHNWFMGLRQNTGTDREFLDWLPVDCLTYTTECMAANNCPNPFQQVHHQLKSSGNDPIIGAPLNMVHSGNKSLRLGNACNNCGIERIEKRFVVTQSNCLFSFWYALVMGKPDQSHQPKQIPTFIVQLYDVSNPSSPINKNNLINLNGTNNYISSNDPILTNVTHSYPCCPSSTTTLAYKPWSYFQVDLSSLINKTVSIEFITRDCAPNGHFIYAYLDDFCSPPDTNNPSGYLGLGRQDTCRNLGTNGSICVNYTLPQTTTQLGTIQLTLKFFQNGIQVLSPITSQVLYSGNSHCFTINDSNSPLWDFDYTVTGDFYLGGVQQPSQIVGLNPPIVPGLNNDFKVPCEPTIVCPCPDTISVSAQNLQYYSAIYPATSSANVNLLLNGTGNYTDVRVNVLDLQIYAKDDQGNPAPACLQCYNNPRSWASIISGSLGSTSNLPVVNGVVCNNPGNNSTDPTNNPREIVFSQNGIMTIHNKPLSIKLVLPGASPISCCHLIAEVTLKITFRNTDCVECESFISGTIEISPKNGNQLFKIIDPKKIRIKSPSDNNYGINDEGIK